MEYYEHPNLSSYYLEDSYVLDLVEKPNTMVFRMEFVLTEDHPRYQAPGPNIQYCYATGSLVFHDVSQVEWTEKHFHVYTDATGEIDYGNIDYLKQENQHWEAGGDWGEVLIYTTSAPAVSLDN